MSAPQALRNRRLINLVLPSLLLGLAIGTDAFARESERNLSKEIPCAALQSIDGDVEALTPDRTGIVALDGQALPCGVWITVKKGSIQLKHRQGFTITAASGTFFEIFDNENGRHQTGPDHVVLYRGKLYLKVKNGMGDLRVATPNARARIDDDTAVVIYNQSLEETQLVSLSHASALENRFIPTASITAKAGESTTLSLSAMRVTPSTPLVVKMAAVKELLNGFPIEGTEVTFAAVAVKTRLDRAFPAALDSAGRMPASEKEKFDAKERVKYARHRNLPGDGHAEALWVGKLVGGATHPNSMLFPNGQTEAERKPASVTVKVLDDPGVEFDRKEQEKINKERERLMRELAKLREI